MERKLAELPDNKHRNLENKYLRDCGLNDEKIQI
jgi:hypothetical protein